MIFDHLLPHHVSHAKKQKLTPLYDIPLYLLFQDSKI
jgi:hypothetical protein